MVEKTPGVIENGVGLLGTWSFIKTYAAGHGKPFDFVVLCLVLAIYLFLRAKELPFVERVMSPIISVALAWFGSDWIAEIIGISDKGAMVIIMLFGLVVLNGFLSFVDDPDFVKHTAKAWALKKMGLSKEDVDDG